MRKTNRTPNIPNIAQINRQIISARIGGSSSPFPDTNTTNDKPKKNKTTTAAPKVVFIESTTTLVAAAKPEGV